MKRAIMMCAAALALVLTVGSVAFAADNEPAIGGYCPVAYAKMGKAIKGDARWSSERDGQTFLFSAAQAKDLFDKSPDRYRVAYRGWCATGVAMARKIAADPEIFTVHKGVTYLFSSAMAKTSFDEDPEATIAKADKAWASLR